MPANHPRPFLSRVFRAIGPGLVTACVVVGPGSILTSSKVGATYGFSKVWVVVLAAFFMLSYVTMGMRIGVVSGKSNGELVRHHIGRWASLLIGLCVFSVAAAYQFGNNLGVHYALSAYLDFDYWIIILNGIVLLFIFKFRNFYRLLEGAMAAFVALMLIAFAVNLSFAKPDPGELVSGLLPSGGLSAISLPVLGLIGTTFVINAAFYQSYLVRFKGWSKSNVNDGILDSRISATIMCIITITIMSTAAAVLRGHDLATVTDVANGLEPLFGEKGRAIFCTGLFAAAFSSFVVNSMTGGFILADALKLGSNLEDPWPRIFTAAVLIIGMLVALFVIKTGTMPVSAIVSAQAVTVVAAPLIAGAMLWIANLKEVMGDQRNGVLMNVVAGTGLLILIAISFHIATEKVWPALQNILF